MKEMPWSSKPKKQAILLVAVVVPGLMFGLGIGGYLLARAIGLDALALLTAMVFSTVGLAISVFLTLNIGKTYDTTTDQSKS
jgi:Kef-type K+ transport system membrane component KefB